MIVTFLALYTLNFSAWRREKVAPAEASGGGTIQVGDARSQQQVAEVGIDPLQWELRREEKSFEGVDSAIGGLSAPQLVGVIQALDLLNEGLDRMILLDLFLSLVRKDHNILFGLLGEDYKSAIFKAFPYFAAEDPTALWDLILQKDPSSGKDRWISVLAYESLGSKNPEEALSVFDEMSHNEDASPFGTMILKRAAAEQPSLVIDFLRENPSAPYLNASLHDVLFTILVADPSFALGVSKSYPELIGDHFLAGIYTSMVRADPNLALQEMASTFPEVLGEALSRRRGHGKTYFSKLFSVDPARSIDLLSEASRRISLAAVEI